MGARRTNKRPANLELTDGDQSPRILKAANVILAGGGLFCLLCLFLLLRRHGWTDEGSFDGGVVLLLLAPALAAVLLFASLRLPPSARTGLALVLFSTTIALYSVELVLQLLDAPGDRERRTLWTPATSQDMDELVRIAREHGVAYDRRSKLEVLMDLRSADPGAVPAIVPKGLLARQGDGTLKSQISIDGVEVVALGGISNRTTVLCNESGEWIAYSSDEHGFHNPAGIWSRSNIEVAVIGDSFAQGVCVPSPQNAVALIRDRYPATVNLGMLGHGPLMELAQLKEYVARLKPRTVLWFFYEENDFADLMHERDSPLLMSYLQGPYRQGLASVQPTIDESLEDYVAGEIEQTQLRGDHLPDVPTQESNIVTGITAVILLGNLRRRLGLTLQSRNAAENHRIASDEAMALLKKIFAEATETVSSWSGRLYFVYIPERQRYTDPATTELNETNREAILRLAGDLGIPVIDIHSAIESQEDPLSLYPFRRRGHFNEEGYRLVAESVLKAIEHPGSVPQPDGGRSPASH